MKFNTVIFDLFGTLVDDFASSVGQMHQEMAAALVVPYEQFISLWGQTAKMRILGAFDSVEANIKYVCETMKHENFFRRWSGCDAGSTGVRR